MKNRRCCPTQPGCALLFLAESDPGIGVSVLVMSNPIPVAVFVRIPLPTGPVCGWENDDEPYFNPDDFYDDTFGGLDDLEERDPYTEEDYELAGEDELEEEDDYDESDEYDDYPEEEDEEDY